jgi:hypothetical protein
MPRGQGVRRPATKFAHLRKQLTKARIEKHVQSQRESHRGSSQKGMS